MRFSKLPGFLLLVVTIVASATGGGHSPVPLDLSLRLRLFDPKFDTKNGKGMPLNTSMIFRHGTPIRVVNGGESDLPEFDEPLQFGAIIDGDTRLVDERTVMLNLKLMISSRFAPENQRDVHQVNGEWIQVCCPVTLGKARTIRCSDSRSLEVLLERSK